MDLISLPVEFDRKKIDGRYRFVTAVTKRARGLYCGVQPKVTTRSKKMTIIALEEVITNAVRVLSGEAALKAKDTAKKLTYEDMMDEAKQKASLPEEMTKIEKHLKAYLHEKGEQDKKQTIDEIFPEEGS